MAKKEWKMPELREAIGKAIESEKFHERERGILKMRFGVEDGEAKTLEQVGKAFGVTRERVRQIEAKVLEEIRQK